jgi:RNA polymerase sigma factor for flagellar operon FliA
LISSGELAARIEAAYDKPRFTGTCAQATDQVRQWGLDGERLLDGVVRYEAGRHLGLVWHQVNRIVANYPGYGTDELFGFGWRGLCVALHNYDPERVSFSTYACTRICGHIADGVRAESPIPKRLNTWYRKVGATIDDLSASLGRPPTDDEVAGSMAAARLARELGRSATLAEVADALEAERRQLHILPRLAVPAGIEEAPVAAGGDDPAEVAVREMLVADVRAALGELDDEERFVIERLELEGSSIDECARQLGSSTRQVRALRQRAHDRLAGRLAGWRDSAVV